MYSKLKTIKILMSAISVSAIVGSSLLPALAVNRSTECGNSHEYSADSGVNQIRCLKLKDPNVIYQLVGSGQQVPKRNIKGIQPFLLDEKNLIMVNEPGNYTIKMRDVEIHAGDGNALNICPNANVRLILQGNNILESHSNTGIYCGNNSTLTIETEDNDSSLNVSGGRDGIKCENKLMLIGGDVSSTGQNSGIRVVNNLEIKNTILRSTGLNRDGIAANNNLDIIRSNITAIGNRNGISSLDDTNINDSKIININNSAITSKGQHNGIRVRGQLNMHNTNINSKGTEWYGIATNNDMDIIDSTITSTGNKGGIRAKKNLTISNTINSDKIKVIGKETGIISNGVTINDGNIEVKGENSAIDSKSIKFSKLGSKEAKIDGIKCLRVKDGMPMLEGNSTGVKDENAKETSPNVGRKITLDQPGKYLLVDDGNGEEVGEIDEKVISLKSNDRIVISSSGKYDITMKDVNIDVSGVKDACAFKVEKDANIELTLVGTNIITGDTGIYVPNGMLTITKESEGNFIDVIGKQYGMYVNKFIINGGNVDTTGKINGIYGREINVNGGNILAGSDDNGIVVKRDLNINDGFIKAIGNKNGIFADIVTTKGGNIDVQGNVNAITTRKLIIDNGNIEATGGQGAVNAKETVLSRASSENIQINNVEFIKIEKGMLISAAMADQKDNSLLESELSPKSDDTSIDTDESASEQDSEESDTPSTDSDESASEKYLKKPDTEAMDIDESAIGQNSEESDTTSMDIDESASGQDLNNLMMQ